MISYREYLKEIESFTEQNMLDQVIAHSTHIIKSYPNSIAALRFLGQAYLEQKKYVEATNYFERLLSFKPDDFVAHVGISASKEEDRDLDAAIFHMEIAFDTQPSNVIVQEELKRLINKRDGTKPQKINLSRGALIRMYIKGDLYQQALNEIEAALASNPERIDLQVLQAQVYALSNLKVQAAEVCNRILTQLPYCLDPNQILLQIYLENGLTEQAAQVQERLISLDPYYKFINSSLLNVEDVPDSKVELEKLEYTSAFSSEAQTYWSTSEIETNPNGLNPIKMNKTDPINEISDSQNISSDLIPDFLSDAGWARSENPQNEPPEPIDYSPDLLLDKPATSELPEWLKNYQPTGDFSNDKVTTYPEISDPLGIILESEPKEEIISNVNEFPVENPSSISEVEMTTDNPQTPSPKDDSSDWMSQFFDDAKKSPPESEDEKGLPDWLKSFGQDEAPAETNTEDEVPDWLKNLDSQIVQNESTEQQVDLNQEASPDSDNSSFISEDKSPFSFENEVPVEDIIETVQETPMESISSEDDFLNSLESLTADVQKTKSPSEVFIQDEKIESVPAPSENSESQLPDWVKSVLSEPDEVKSDLNPVGESPEDEVFEVENIPTVELSPSNESEDLFEESEGAISQDAGDELLQWLRGISPEKPETVSSNEFENIISPEPSSNSEILEESLSRLDEISENAPETSLESQTMPEVFESTTSSFSADETQLTENLQSDLEPSELHEIDEEVAESESVVFPDTTLHSTPIEKFQSLLATSNYVEATASLPELTSAGFDSDKILEIISTYKNEKIDDFDYLQFLGDTLAGFDRFDEALDVYSKAENILTGK